MVFRCVTITAIEKTERSKDTINSQENSETVGVGEEVIVGDSVGFDETELADIVIVCVGLQSLS